MSERRDIKLFIQDVFDAIDKINSYVLNITNEASHSDAGGE